MSEKTKKVPLTGKERAKIFYYKNLEKERLRKNNDYSRNKELLGLPPPKKQNKTTKPSTQTTPSSTQDTSSNQITSSTQATSLTQNPSSTKTTSSTQTPSSTKTYNTIST